MTRLIGMMTTCAVLAGLVSGASAQAPQSTTATYDAWQLRCETRAAAEGAEALKVCEVVQVVQVQGQAQPLMQIAVGSPAPDAPITLVMQLPIGVWIPAAPQFFVDPDASPLTGSFKRCAPVACFADAELTPEMMRAIEARGDEQGAVVFQMTEGQNASIPISFKGFIAAYNAMINNE